MFTSYFSVSLCIPFVVYSWLNKDPNNMSLFSRINPFKRAIYNPHDPHVRWWMSLTAPQIFGAPDYFDIWLPGMKRRSAPDTNEEWKQDVQGGWGLQEDDDWFTTIQDLSLGNMHGQSWGYLFRERALATATEWHDRQQSVNPIIANELEFVDMVYRHVGTAGFRAWDYSRGGFVVRAGYHVGVISEEEWAFFLNYMSHEAQDWFSSWDEYCKSYLFGYNYWSYINNKESGIDSTDRLLGSGTPQDYGTLFNHLADGSLPLNDIAWDTQLPDIPMPQSLQDRFQRIQDQED